jgi:hypothetical protein
MIPTTTTATVPRIPISVYIKILKPVQEEEGAGGSA